MESRNALRNYLDFLDDELILLLQNGDDNAFEELRNRYDYLVKSYSKLFVNVGLEFDDYEQEAALGLLDAARSYNNNSAATFKTYAAVCVKRKVISAYRTATSKKNSPLNFFLSLDSKDIAVESSPEQKLIEQERIDKLINKIKTELSGFELLVLLSHLEGNSYHQIASTLDTTAKSVNNALQRARRKLKI